MARGGQQPTLEPPFQVGPQRRRPSSTGALRVSLDVLVEELGKVMNKQKWMGNSLPMTERFLYVGLLASEEISRLKKLSSIMTECGVATMPTIPERDLALHSNRLRGVVWSRRW